MRDPHPSMSTSSTRTTPESLPLAWSGWSLRVPEEWRPLKIAGGAGQGTMVLGDSAEATMQVKWWRPPGSSPRAERWAKARLRRFAVSTRPDWAALDSFTDAVWVQDAGESSGPGRSLFCGYAPRAELLLELTINTAASESARRVSEREVLPSLTTVPRDEPTPWAVFDSSFLTPPGHDLARHRLNIGDHVVAVASPKGARITVRQVYPADLALARRDLEDWLTFGPFKEHRRFNGRGDAAAWSIDVRGRASEGLLRVGSKRLPSPLGWLAPRHSTAAVVRDQALDRLLIAEVDSPTEPDPGLLRALIADMNRRHDRPAAGGE